MVNKAIAVACILAIALCAGTGSLANITFQVPNAFSTASRTTAHKAIFERNGNIYLFDSEENAINSLSEGGKYSPLVSPDNTKILYRRSVFETPGNTLVFGILDISGNDICEITIDTPFSNEIVGLEWITNDKVAVTTHVNPSTSEYFVYDISQEKLINSANGGSFAVVPGTNKVIYEKNVPHWSNESVNHSYKIDDKIVYTSSVKDAKLGTPVFSDDLSKIAFVETQKNNASESKVTDSSYLIVCDFDTESLILTQKSKISIEANVTGHLAFSGDVVCFVNSDTVYWYDEASNTFMQEKTETNLRNEASDPQRMESLQKAVTALWNDGSLKAVNSINWIEE